MKITVWNEYRQELTDEPVKAVYPNGIHTVIADFLEKAGHEVTIATLDMPEHGLTEEVLDNTDVLIWWGHIFHDAVSDEVAARVQQHVLDGMGFIVLHASFESKPFKRLIGAKPRIRWRENDEKEIIWTINPSHPIAKNVGANIILEQEETYGELFGIPKPDEIVFISWYSGGEVFRSGVTYHRGEGRIFYFKPGHETYPVYQNEEIQKVIINACDWANNQHRQHIPSGKFPDPIA